MKEIYVGVVHDELDLYHINARADVFDLFHIQHGLYTENE